MKKTISLSIVSILISFTQMASAISIGVTMSRLDDNFLTILRGGMEKYAKRKKIKLQILDANDDVSKQLSQVENFIAKGVDAIIVNAVDTDTTTGITKKAKQAGIPLVYVNRQPIDLKKLGRKATFVGSDEKWSGTLKAFEICRLASGTGRAVMLMGQLSNEAARSRSQDVREVLKLSMCNKIKLIEEQTANWSRIEANDIVSNWLSKGLKFDIVFANNDEMAIGAIQALKNAKIKMKDVLIGGVDATEDALNAMKNGDLDVTVFQNAAAQGEGSINAAIALSKGKKLPNFVVVPFELVTPQNIKKYMNRN